MDDVFDIDKYFTPKDREFSHKQSELIHNWVMKNGDGFGCDAKQLNFIKIHNLHFSTQYIGMVRCYKDNRTIWQTSCGVSLLGAIFEDRTFKIDFEKSYLKTKDEYDRLSAQVRGFLDKLLELPEETLNELLTKQHVGLFSN